MAKKEKIVTTKILSGVLEKARKYTEEERELLYVFISKAVEEKLSKEIFKKQERV